MPFSWCPSSSSMMATQPPQEKVALYRNTVLFPKYPHFAELSPQSILQQQIFPPLKKSPRERWCATHRALEIKFGKSTKNTSGEPGCVVATPAEGEQGNRRSVQRPERRQRGGGGGGGTQRQTHTRTHTHTHTHGGATVHFKRRAVSTQTNSTFINTSVCTRRDQNTAPCIDHCTTPVFKWLQRKPINTAARNWLSLLN